MPTRAAALLLCGGVVVTQDPYAAADAAAALVAERTGHVSHHVAVVLGSGWNPAADLLCPPGDGVELSFADLGDRPAPSVAGHVGKVRSVEVAGHRTLVFLGRVHLYEGHPPATVVHNVRTACAAGCDVVVLTNAAGGINPSYDVGQLVLIRDHVNLTAMSPLSGPPPPAAYPVRFVDLTDAYSPRLRTLARDVDPSLPEGVYAALTGPHFETPAEISMLRRLGADLVGMSTALEAIAARHLGAEVLGVSLVTNAAAGVGDSGVDHGEVVAAGEAHAASAGSLIASILARLP